VRLVTRSFPQRIPTVVVRPSDFDTVEALITDLKPSAEGSWRAQILDCVTDGLIEDLGSDWRRLDERIERVTEEAV
jgi:hypothetical protein